MTEPADVPVYVALGDSISIDDYAGGPGRGGASLLHRNRDDDFPQWRGRDLASQGGDFRLLATDGATTSTLLDVQLPRLAGSGVRPTLVTLTIGGNDVLSAYGSTAVARRTVREVGDAVRTALAQVHALLAPGGKVVVGTVYDPSDGTADAERLGLPPWPQAVEVLAELNVALRAAAADSGARVAEIAELFLGHGLSAGDPAGGDPRPSQRDLWFCHLVEPNAWGADGVRTAFWTAASG